VEVDKGRRELISVIERKEAALAEFEAGIPARIRAYEDEIKRAPGYVEFRDDPLLRLRAYLELKSDTVYGPGMTWFASGLALFIIFLEVVPVLAKMLLAPPSAYAIRIQEIVERHQRREFDAEDNFDAEDDRADAWGGWLRASADRQQHGRGRHLTIVR
jgi:hypothetical protein